MTIYLDAVWALNFFLDGMLLLLTQAVANELTKKIRILFGAFIASLLVPISLFFPSTPFTSLPGKLFYSFLIIFVTFGFYSISRFIKLLALFYFISFAIGGGLIAVYFLTNDSFHLSETGFLTFHSGLGDPLSWLFVIIGFPLSWYFTKKRMDKHAIEKIRYEQLYPVHITIKQITHSTTGYIDSGNQLIDPLTKRYVIICDEVFLKQWFTNEEWNELKEAYKNMDILHLPNRWNGLLQVVPFMGVGGKNHLLLAIRPEQVIIDYDKKKIVTHKVIIGIQFGTLTKDCKYHCLLHPQIFKLEAKNTA